MEPRTAPQDRPLSVALAGMAALAVAMGVGRFAFTPLLPMMLSDGVITLVDGSWLATANYVGYLLGALACMALPWVAPKARQRWHPARLARWGLAHVNCAARLTARCGSGPTLPQCVRLRSRPSSRTPSSA